jgi:hypothetical protein
MGQGGFVMCEWDSVFREYPRFQSAFAALEAQVTEKCRLDWHPLKPIEQCYGRLNASSSQFGRTTIMPELFVDHSGTVMAHWRQLFTSSGHQMLIGGAGSGYVLPEDFKVAWMGLMFPNKNQHITEIKMQIGDRKFGRINIEEMKSYNKPAIIFEEGYQIDEKEGFELYGYVEGPLPISEPFIAGLYQRIVMIGAAYFNVKDKVLGNCGAAIPTT